MKAGIIVARGSEPFELATGDAVQIMRDARTPTAANELHEALKDISRRPTADVTGAIQHAMAALECVAREIDGSTDTLGKIIGRLSFPPPLDAALHKLWGFASEQGRHIQEGRELRFEEAELVVIADAAARGWPVFTAIKDAKGAREQMSAYHTALAASGHDEETIRLAKEWSSVGKAVHVAETDAQARSEAEDFFARNPSGAIARSPDDMVCGSPETVARIMNEFATTGIGVMICGFLIDVENPERVRRSVRLFEEKVIPNVVGVDGGVGRRAMAN